MPQLLSVKLDVLEEHWFESLSAGVSRGETVSFLSALVKEIHV